VSECSGIPLWEDIGENAARWGQGQNNKKHIISRTISNIKKLQQQNMPGTIRIFK